MLLNLKLHNQLEICACHMSKIIHKKQDKTAGYIDDFEQSLSRTVMAEWTALAEEAVSKGVKAYNGKATKAQANKIIATVNRIMGQFGSKELEKTIENQLEIFYQEITTRFIKEHKLVVQKASRTNTRVKPNFTLQDKAAIGVTQKITVQSAGRFFPDQVAGKTSEVIKKVVLELGLPTEDAAIRLQAELEGALGVEQTMKLIPSQFATNPLAYFQIVADNASVQASSVGRMLSMNDAGVEKYKVSAVIDNRTSEICLKLDGREFTVAKSMQAVNQFLEVSSLNDLETLMPFSSADTVPTWADEGLGFPPYHHACRTVVIPIGF